MRDTHGSLVTFMSYGGAQLSRVLLGQLTFFSVHIGYAQADHCFRCILSKPYCNMLPGGGQ
jgi:hypothetical protein